MARKRKRNAAPADSDTTAPASPGSIKHQTLSAYYPFLYTLSTFLQLAHGYTLPNLVLPSDSDTYAQILSTTLVSSQTPLESRAPSLTPAAKPEIYHTQPETLDRLVNSLVLLPSDSSSSRPTKRRRRNCLALGFQTYDRTRATNRNRPTVEHRVLNSSVAELRKLEWKILHSRIGTTHFMQLFERHALYLPTGPLVNKCYIQLAGEPLCDMYPLAESRKPPVPQRIASKVSPINILLPRQKIFYAQTMLPNGLNAFRHALPKHHILNVLTAPGKPACPSDADCRTLLRHVFPKQFGLRNVFTKAPGTLSKWTKMAPGEFQIDSGNRAREIHVLSERARHDKGSMSIPKRLRGEILGLMREMIVRFRRLGVESLTGRYLRLEAEQHDHLSSISQQMAPQQATQDQVPSQAPPEDISFEVPSVHLSQIPPVEPKPRCLARANPHGQVHRFMKRVLSDLLPRGLLGSDDNLRILCKHLLHFICAKQHDALSLHGVLHGLSVAECSWLAAGDPTARVCQAESLKRKELLAELVYWIFDGLVIPILKATFYITETAVTKFETVYFQRKIWDEMAQPHLDKLGSTLLEEVPELDTHQARSGILGVSNVRLVPKENGFRPIANMGRSRKMIAGVPTIASANDELTAVYRVLTLHKNQRRAQLDSTLFGTNEIFPKLQAFKRRLADKDGKLPRLYFVKMDIKAAFDTIDQGKMVQVLRELFEEEHDYTVGNYAQLLPESAIGTRVAAAKLFKQRARTTEDTALFRQHSITSASAMRNAIFVDLVRNELHKGTDCSQLLETLVGSNMVQISGKLYRQARGIPQGSKVSSMLCSLLYAHLENVHMQWTNNDHSLLLRYIDDYLFITTDLALANRFIRRMQRGFKDYGAFTAPDKTLVSFESHDGDGSLKICDSDSSGNQAFPYCGFTIDTATLSIRADHSRIVEFNAAQSFSLRSAKQRGKGFFGWLSRQLENRNHIGLLDISHSGEQAVRHNIILNFMITSMKIPHYFRAWGTLTPPQARCIFDALVTAIAYTYTSGCARVHYARSPAEGRVVSKQTFEFLALSSLRRVLSQKAAKFGNLLHLLAAELGGKTFRSLQGSQQTAINQVWDLVKNTKY